MCGKPLMSLADPVWGIFGRVCVFTEATGLKAAGQMIYVVALGSVQLDIPCWIHVQGFQFRKPKLGCPDLHIINTTSTFIG
jgi:hypothetical protein